MQGASAGPPSGHGRPTGHLRRLYAAACRIDVEAFKPGNVSVHAAGHDMTADQFVRSARASAAALVEPGCSVGLRIHQAVAATRRAVGCNTNLGIILLAAPLLMAAECGAPMREALRAVLAGTGTDDARETYAAIRLAQPGGLGEAPAQDVCEEPTLDLRAVMALAADRDSIARQYVTDYADIFEWSMPAFREYRVRHGDIWAAVRVYAGFLRRMPDSHVRRKRGVIYDDFIRQRMTGLEFALLETDQPESLRPRIHSIDAEFKSLGINPGTTADLTVATVLATYLDSEAICATTS